MRAGTIGKYAVLLTLMSVMAVAAALPQTGFVIYSKGDGGNRTLHRRVIVGGALQAEEKICDRGSYGGDIQGVLSHDGKILAFSRSLTGTSNNYGGNDYHDHWCWDIYVVRLDGSLPATPTRVGHGYFPCWGDDSHTSSKTLYYSVYESTEIHKATIGDDGSVSNVGLHFSGSPIRNEMMMPAPNGNMVAYRKDGRMRIYHHAGPMAGNDYDAEGGCMPSWMANSRWLIHAKATISRNDGQHQKYKYFETSLGSYHLGSSVDMEWLISRTDMDSFDRQNLGLTVKVTPITVTDNDWVADVGQQTTITNDGSWVDIHSGEMAPPEVVINAFWAVPANTVPGVSTTLHWDVDFAQSISINGDVVTGDSLVVTPSSTTTYTLTATGDPAPVTAEVTVEVSAPELTSINLTASETRVNLGETVTISAQTLDQVGAPFTATVDWSVSGSGNVSPSSGDQTTYTAPLTMAGEVTIVATSGTVSDSIELTVVDPNALRIKINCGENTYDVSGWDRDDDYVTSGGTDWTNPNTIDLSGVTDPAPADVYQSVLRTAHTFSVDIPDGDYLVRIHFADAYGGRSMQYSIEDSVVLSSFDPVVEAGGANKAVVMEFDITVDDGNGMQIAASLGGGNDVFECGIEIIGSGSTIAPETILLGGSLGGSSYGEGDVLVVEWDASSDVSSVMINLSLDGGENWLDQTLNPDQIERGPAWGRFEWTIPSTFDGVSTVSDFAIIKVTDYDNQSVNVSSGIFSITPGSTISDRSMAALAVRKQGVHVGADGAVVLTAMPGVETRVTVARLDGKVVLREAQSAGTRTIAAPNRLSPGTYVVKVESAVKVGLHRIMIR